MPRRTPTKPESEDNPIDTELPLAAAEQLMAEAATAAAARPMRPSTCSIASRPAKAGVERSHILPFALDGSLLLEIYVHDGIGTMVIDEKLESPARGHQPTMWAAFCS